MCFIMTNSIAGDKEYTFEVWRADPVSDMKSPVVKLREKWYDIIH